MNQMYMLLIGVLGIAAIGSLLQSDDDEEFDEGTPIPDLPLVEGDDSAEKLDGTDAAEILVRRPPEAGAAGSPVTALAWDRSGGRLAFGLENGAAGLLSLPQA